MRLARSQRGSVPTRRLALSGVLAWLAVGCDFPDPEACVLTCGPHGECPGTFECQPETRMCAPRGWGEPCTSTLTSPGGAGGSAAGAGGAPDAGGGAPAMPGGPDPSELADAGHTPPIDEPPSGALAIELPIVASACSGAALDLDLRARGGQAPYVWRLLDAPDGVQLLALGPRARLVGAPRVAGAVRVGLEDAAGERATTAALEVEERPVIATSALPVICSGARYGAPLEAWGGDADAYVWSARVVDDDSPSLDELALRVDGSSLHGAPPPDSETGPVRLELALSDGHCEAEAVEIDLDVAPAESDACPSIEIAGLVGADILPRPCRGNRYMETLTVDGGEPPFTWTEMTTPPGLHFDVDSGTVEGIAERDGELVVAVTDAGGRSVDASYDVRLRDTCWLAYVAGGVAPARLTLVDAHLLRRQPDAARRVLPVDAPTDAVFDFRFSPDGRFLAYRLGSAPDALRLELVRVSDAATASLDLNGPVSQYAWSNDSAILFAAAGSEQRTLHGVDVSAVRGGAGELLGARALAVVSIPDTSGALVGFGARKLAFSTPVPGAPERLRLVTAGVAGGRITPPTIRSELDFSLAASVTGASTGVVVADPATGAVTLFPDDGRAPVSRSDVLVSASGALAAGALDGMLSIFDAASPSGVAPLFQRPSCDRLLAWSSRGDRLSCSSGTGASAGLSFFALGSTSLVDLGTPSPPGSGVVGDLLGVRRVLSDGGRWFAAPDARGLAVWALTAGGPRLAAHVPESALGAPVTSLAFSPDERRLLVGSGNRLGMLELEATEPSLIELSPSALLDDACDERSVNGLSRWCGSDSSLSALRWSTDSSLVAFRSSLGALTLSDLNDPGGAAGVPFSPDVDCEEACVSGVSARFQP